MPGEMVAKVPQKLFTPVKIGKMALKNRLAMAPIGAILSPYDQITQRFKDFYIARARGGVGMIVMAGVVFTDIDRPLSPPATEQATIEAGELVKALHEYDVRVGTQIHHSGRQVDAAVAATVDAVAPSPIPWSRHSPVPKELSAGEIEELILRHVRTAVKVKEVGFDFVEIQACHGYLLSGFLSPNSNRRTDEYGGDLKRRAKIVLEIIRRVKEEVGNELLICCRFNGSDHIEGGLTIEDAKTLAPLLVKAGADFLSVTAGVFRSYPVIVSPFDTPQGCYIHLAEAVKSVADVPVIAVGRINDPWLAEDILQAGKADIIAMARALFADPELPVKSMRGEFDDIRKCISCNQGCQDRVADLEPTCLVNPAATREHEMEIVPSAKPKKVVVIGGGIAGLEVSRVAALRGHKVTLYEENDELGGQWRLAAVPPHKEEFREVIAYLSRQVKKVGVTLKLGEKATAMTVAKEKPDVVVIATGAMPLIPPIPGIESSNVMTAWDVLAGKSATGGQVLIIGGNSLGLETADFLASQGKKVVVVEMLDRIGRDLGPTVRFHLQHRLSAKGVQSVTSAKVKEISSTGGLIAREGKQEVWKDFDTIVLATGSKSRSELTDEIKGKVKEVYVIGDAARPRNGLYAIREGFEIGRTI